VRRVSDNKIIKTDKDLEQEQSEKIMQTVARKTAYFRANPHRFCSEYLDIKLKLFQKILLFMINISTNFMYIAARGQGKSFLIAIFCVVRCILYPGTRICLASKARKQATEILEKITAILMPNSENLRNEIKDTVINQATAHIEFYNGSKIIVITANDNARSNRANILVVDEFRLVDKDIIDKVLRKFLTAPRQPDYLTKPEYSHLQERNKEMYLSSAWFQSHWSFEKLKSYAANLINEKRRYFVCGLPYQLSIKENLLMRDQIEDEMSETDFSQLAFEIEMGCMWFSDSDGSLYSYDNISKSRKIRFGIYPPSLANKLNDKRIKVQPRLENEKRILSLDIALMGSGKGKKNDASSIFINQLVQVQNHSDRFTNNIIYTENHEGILTEQLALLTRRLFHEFECTDLVIDCKGVGHGVLEAIQKDIYDSESGETYEALNVRNNDEWAARCLVPNAPKVIWAINNQTAKFNSDCALGLLEAFRQGKIRLLVSEYSADEELSELKGYINLPLEDKLKFLAPYTHTGLLINELIGLDYEAKDGIVRVKEKSGERKDRYSSLSYNIWVSRQLEAELKKPKKAFDPAKILSLGRKASPYKK